MTVARRLAIATVAAIVIASARPLAGQATTATHPASPKAPAAAAAKPADVKTVVERIQERIEKEVVDPAVRKASARSAGATRPAPTAARRSSAAAPGASRIRLVWRVSLQWPDDLDAAR